MNKRAVQSLRGMACVLLVLYHVVGATPGQGLRIESGLLRVLTDALAAVRMPLFALLAGALYGLGSKKGMDLVKDKFLRLMVPMFTVGTMFALAQYLTPYSSTKIHDWYLLHIIPVAHYWFLESLFLIFCVMALLEQLMPLHTARQWLAVFAVSVLAYLAHPGIVWFSLLGANYLFPYFLLGLALRRFGWDKLSGSSTFGICLLLLGLALALMQYIYGDFLQRFNVPMLTMGLAFASGLWLRPFQSRVLARIGDYSYTIYLFHVFFTASTRFALHAMGCYGIGLNMVLGLAAGILGSIVVHRFIKLSPLACQLLLGMHKVGTGLRRTVVAG